MFDDNSSDRARTVFAGLTPTVAAQTATEREASARPLSKGVMATVPIVLAGALTMTGAIAPAQAAPSVDRKATKPKTSLGSSVRTVVATAAAKVTTAPPATYTVKAGDTVSSIAGRYGLATASVLAANGLGWKSLIFPGQVLKLTSAAVAPAPQTPAPSAGGRYTIVKGDTISGIAARHGVSTKSVLSANGLSASSIIYPGQTIAIPSSTLAVENVSSVTPAPATPVVDESNDPPSTPVVGTPPASTGARYVIKSGDTVSSIAARYGVTVNSILEANGLSRSSIIYAGRTLTIPGASIVADASGVTPMTSEMAANAAIIVQIGRELGVSDRGIIIALATAMQESSLRNINYGDRDSLGLFQQRPSTGWGTPEQVLNAPHAARLFYGGPQNPNKGKTRGLLDISGWESMSLTQAAQAVQISAFPNAYAKWETSATAWLAQLS